MGGIKSDLKAQRGKTNFIVENGAVVHQLETPISPSGDGDPNITKMHAQIIDSSNVRIGHEYQYHAPVNIYVENFQLPANSGNIKSSKSNMDSNR